MLDYKKKYLKYKNKYFKLKINSLIGGVQVLSPRNFKKIENDINFSSLKSDITEEYINNNKKIIIDAVEAFIAAKKAKVTGGTSGSNGEDKTFEELKELLDALRKTRGDNNEEILKLIKKIPGLLLRRLINIDIQKVEQEEANTATARAQENDYIKNVIEKVEKNAAEETAEDAGVETSEVAGVDPAKDAAAKEAAAKEAAVTMRETKSSTWTSRKNADTAEEDEAASTGKSEETRAEEEVSFTVGQNPSDGRIIEQAEEKKKQVSNSLLEIRWGKKDDKENGWPVIVQERNGYNRDAVITGYNYDTNNYILNFASQEDTQDVNWVEKQEKGWLIPNEFREGAYVYYSWPGVWGTIEGVAKIESVKSGDKYDLWVDQSEQYPDISKKDLRLATTNELKGMALNLSLIHI